MYEIIDVPTIRTYRHKYRYIQDVESRLPAGHRFGDSAPVTSVHECVHGINSRLRNQYAQERGKVNCFYLLDGKALITKEPDFPLTDIAPQVPSQLRGNIYQLYVVNQARSWRDRPTYLFDEWSAYQAGCMMRTDAGLSERADSITSMLEMAAYCAYIVLQKFDDYGVGGTFEFLMQRTKQIYDASAGKEAAASYLAAVKDTDVEAFWYKNGVRFE